MASELTAQFERIGRTKPGPSLTINIAGTLDQLADGDDDIIVDGRYGRGTLRADS